MAEVQVTMMEVEEGVERKWQISGVEFAELSDGLERKGMEGLKDDT